MCSPLLSSLDFASFSLNLITVKFDETCTYLLSLLNSLVLVLDLILILILFLILILIPLDDLPTNKVYESHSRFG